MANTIHDYLKDFPTLHSISNEAEATRNAYVQKKSEIEKSERYADNEAERKYQLETAEAEYKENMDRLEEKYNIEIAAIEKDLTERAFSTPVGTAEEQAEAEQLVNTVSAQLATTPDVMDTLSLLSDKAQHMSDVEKVAIAEQLGSLSDKAKGRAVSDKQKYEIAEIMKGIQKELSNIEAFNSVSKQREALKRIKENTSPVGLQRTFDLAAKAAKGDVV